MPATSAGTRPSCYALLGNPNTGKTTLFNRLCGMRAKTANFSGSTVEARIGSTKLDDHDVCIVDVAARHVPTRDIPLALGDAFSRLRLGQGSPGDAGQGSSAQWRVVTAGWDGRVRVFRLRDMRPVSVFTYHVGAVYSLATAARGHLLLTGGREGHIACWEL